MRRPHAFYWRCCWAYVGQPHYKTCRVRRAQERVQPSWEVVHAKRSTGVAPWASRALALENKAERIPVPRVLPQNTRCSQCLRSFKDGVHVVEDGYTLLGAIVHGACLGAFVHGQSIKVIHG